VIGSPTEELFAGLLQHPSTNLSTPIAYSVYPGTKSYSAFETKTKERSVTTIRNDATAHAVLDEQNGVVMTVFWNATGGLVDFPSVSVTSDHGVILIFNYWTGKLTFADPTQTLQNATATLTPCGTGKDTAHNVTLAFLQGESAGNSSTISVKGW